MRCYLCSAARRRPKNISIAIFHWQWQAPFEIEVEILIEDLAQQKLTICSSL
jgi:hypothetical protein